MESAQSTIDPETPDKFGDGETPGDGSIAERYRQVRGATESLVRGLAPEDQNLQSMAEASPAKWHRAHTTWFFETFILADFVPDYQWVDPVYCELFNSYYNGVGRQHPRPQRSLISRPDTEAVGAYRQAIDRQMLRLLDRVSGAELARLTALVELGLNHEQQHQELILTDIKHAFSHNPLAPALGGAPPAAEHTTPANPDWQAHPDGIFEIGFNGNGFCFDNETPRHRVCIPLPFELASRPVTCGEFLEFMQAGGYENPLLWLSDGWAWVQSEHARSPLYWQHRDGAWMVRTLTGERPVNPAEPVCHVNFYEAQAYAEWAGCRLPTEAEWELAATAHPVSGHFADRGRFHPEPDDTGGGQWFGSVWEWTSSAYAAYPGFRPAAGAVGEYNGKFMANQMVLRGGSCATPAGHVRPSYRNFFYPSDRWQFSGLRLARNSP